MAKIHHLSVTHFRGIKRFDQTFSADFVCLIGRGDSGKSTILEAISYVLSSSWNIQFFDNDFNGCDIEVPIEIEASIKGIPSDLLSEEKYGLYLRALDPSTNTIIDEIEENELPVLTIRLEVKKDLEPKWSVVTKREVGSKPIIASDRGRLNSFLVADYLDRHFSWNKGSPLHTLFLQYAKRDEDDTTMIE
jgi:putative ATP-dependent endonuclease of OLD family